MNFKFQDLDELRRAGLEQELRTLLGRVESIDPRHVWRASKQLDKCEKERAGLESKVADLMSAFERIGFAVPIATEGEPHSGGAPTLNTSELAVALGSMNHGLLSVLRIQQQFQAVGSLIERHYAYVIAWGSIYVAMILGLAAIALGFYPIWEVWHRTAESRPVEVIPTKSVGAPRRLAVFPVRFSSNATGDAGHWSAGVVPRKAEEESLAFLMRSLHGCSDAAGRNVIRLNVVGFASSAEFSGRTSEQSSTLNLDAANRRASEVASILQRLRDGEGLTAQVAIETRPWPTFEAMEDHRPFNDRPTAARGEHDQEVFNRVVEVEMVDAGGCEALSKK
jgi:hypothetical protein